MTAVVSLQHVTKEYAKHRVLSDISFDIGRRDVVGLLGPSGIGKTTVLRIIAGLDTQSSGSVTVNAKRIAYVFQEARLLPWKTALENAALPLISIGIKKKQAEKKAAHFLGLMGLAEFTQYYPGKLSVGMMQRVSLARAFAIEPDLLLLDEPFSALDIERKKALLSLLDERLRAQPMTVVYVSHSPEEVATIANRIFVMSEESGLKELPVDSDIIKDI